MTVIKLVGALYLIYLGVQAIRHRTSLSAALNAKAEPVADRRALRQGFVVGMTNPKTIVFFAAVLPQFAEPAAGSVPVQFLILGVVFQAIAVASDSIWVLLAGRGRTWFARSPKRLEAVGGVGGLMIIGVGASVAVSGSTH